MALKRIGLLPVLSALAFALCGCGAPDHAAPSAQVPPGGTLLKGAGATFPSLLYKKWFTLYGADHAGTVISYDVVGSGEGVRRFIGSVKDEEKIDFGASDSAMTDAEIARVSGGALLMPATAGAVVLAYNVPGISGDLKLSRAAYVGIFLGDIKAWDDRKIVAANPGLKLPHRTIAPVVRQDASGTTFAFTNHLSAISTKWHDKCGASTLVNWPGPCMRAKGNEGVAGLVQHSEGSIGYMGKEFATKVGLPVAVLENREGQFVQPTAQSASAALAAISMPENMRAFVTDPEGRDSYPIVTFSWVLLYRSYPDRRKAEALAGFFRWCLNEGQKLAPDLGYVPLPPSVTSKATAALDSAFGETAGKSKL